MADEAQREAIVQQFKQKRARLVDLGSKIEDLSAQIAEHSVVIKALEPMEASRKCFRLIGDVLVERTVGETLPAVVKNRDNLQAIVKQLTETFEEAEKQFVEFQKKYGIKERQAMDDEPEEGGASGSGASKPSPTKSQGVLVK